MQMSAPNTTTNKSNSKKQEEAEKIKIVIKSLNGN
eukprot:CAMPEP_0197022974 /NCGR_PEP_ID=MMETSP1384-20130603/3771_1 /TAXON_ID=29189 /ORGANISM="Ammonia sp." /LENGTH=34 /DNA_ID= /DNA_START= /DNA_END= /DNA_ORIENTATION=